MSFTPPASILRSARSARDALARRGGIQVRRMPVWERELLQSGQPVIWKNPVGHPDAPLVEQPGIVFSSVRSGSTLLRAILDAHSEIHAPHELHLSRLQLRDLNANQQAAMEEIGLNQQRLNGLLWDRVLHRELVRSQKSIVVSKTPRDTLAWRHMLNTWPQARVIYLVRHPAAIVNSWNAARPQWTREETAEDVLGFVTAMAAARARLPGIVVRYEDLTADPRRETQRICAHLGVPWEAGMLAYRTEDLVVHRGLGDWSEKFRSGQIQPSSLPDEDTIPECLRGTARDWGYLGPASGS